MQVSSEQIKIRLSIIICTYNRADYLRDCLQSLVEQKANKELYQVIVINNNSTDSTLSVAKSFQNKFSHYKVVTEKKQGLSHARNRGFQEASGEWIGYVDDDGQVRSDCVDLVFFTIDHYDFDCFGGVIVESDKRPKPKWLNFNLYPRHGETQKEGIVELKDACFFGGLCFWKRDIFDQFCFDPKLGMNGNNIGYSEEVFLQHTLRANGKKIGVNPVLVLEHAIPEHKQKVSWFIKSNYAIGKNYWLKNPGPCFFDLFRIIAGTIFLLLRNLIAIPFLFLRNKKYYIQNSIITAFGPVANRLGRLVSACRLLFKR